MLFLQKENLTDGRSEFVLIAPSTWDPISVPELQALPPEQDMPEMSRLNSNMSARSLQGKDTFSTVYSDLLGSITPLKSISGIAFCSSSIIYDLSAWI
ncbi:hypothetical protein D3C81_1370790 [compost metagenome]